MRASTLFLLAVLLCSFGYFCYTISNLEIPCVTPLRYSLASVDPRFNLSRAKAEADLAQAAAVWNRELGWGAIVAASGTPNLPVSFVYDDTQATIDKIGELSGNIDELKAQLTDVANQYATLKKQYDALNARGLATKDMYDELQSLYNQYEALRKKINADVAQGQALPQGSVEEGLYTSDKNGTRITIYAFQSGAELTRTLTHEFGHALGLEHVANAASIMYPSNSASQSLDLTAEDRAELARACGESQHSILGVLYVYEQRALHAFGLD